jgi:phage RecT family recombinase
VAPTQPPAKAPPELPLDTTKVGDKYVKELLLSPASLQSIQAAMQNGTLEAAKELVNSARQYIQLSKEKRKLLMCSPKSIYLAVRMAAKLGLDFLSDECYLVAMTKWAKDEKGEPRPAGFYAACWPGYKGLILIASRAGYHLDVQEVRENDSLEIWAGTENIIKHKIGFDGRGDLKGVYCVVRNKDAKVLHIETIERAELELIKSRSDIWNDWFGPMSRKTVIKRAVKVLPRPTEQFKLVTAVEKCLDEGQDANDLLDEGDHGTIIPQTPTGDQAAT